MPGNNTYGGNYHASHHTYQGWKNNRHNYHIVSFLLLHTNCDQWHFHNRGSTRKGSWFHHTYLHEYSNNVFHAHINSENNWQPSQNAGPTSFEGNSLASVMLEQTILQTLITSIEMFDGTKSKFKAWIKSIKKFSTNFWSKCHTHSFFLN